MIQSPANLIPHVLNGVRGHSLVDNGTAAIQPHSATVVLAQLLVEDWMNAVREDNSAANHQYQWTYDLITSLSATSPYVRTQCLPAQNLSADADRADFPYIWRPTGVGGNLEDFTVWQNVGKNASIDGIDRNETAQIRGQWPPPPMDDFGDSLLGIDITGLLIEWPWAYGYRAVVNCAVSAAWHNTTVQSTRSTTYDAWSSALAKNDFGPYRDPPDSDEANRTVTLDRSWLELLTPTTGVTNSDSTGLPLTTLESLLVATGLSRIVDDIGTRVGLCGSLTLDDNTTKVELWNDPDACNEVGINVIRAILAMLVVDGLSRYESHRVFDYRPELSRSWQPHVPETFNKSQLFAQQEEVSLPWTLEFGLVPKGSLPSVWLTVNVVGYAYNPSSASDYLALFGVCVYLVLASSHLIYSLCKSRRSTSSAWDSVTELLVLCQNSPPPATSHKL